jgi:uncharacterized membrane protein YdcZ (DUF606 family)
MCGAIPPLSQYVMVWCLVKHRDFTFTITVARLWASIPGKGGEFFLFAIAHATS